MTVRTAGIDETLKKLDEEIQRIEGATQAAFWEAGLEIINKSLKIAPADTGNLRGSAYVRNAQGIEHPGPSNTATSSAPTGILPDIGVEVGYHAKYAAAVHENVERKLDGMPRTSGTGKGTYWDSGEPKFLESVVLKNLDLIPEIIRKRTEMDKERRL